MAILKNCEIHFTKLDPKRPNAKYNKKNPTWELQIRTRDKETRKSWEALNLGVKIIEPDDDSPMYYRVNLRKKSIKADGTPADPVKVVNGSLMEIDPNTIGNGSVGHIRIFQYEYTNEDNKKGIASVLMAIQLTKHIVYVPKPRDDDFEMEETETIQATGDGGGDVGPEDDDIPFDGGKKVEGEYIPKTQSPAPSPKLNTTTQVDPGGDY